MADSSTGIEDKANTDNEYLLLTRFRRATPEEKKEVLEEAEKTATD